MNQLLNSIPPCFQDLIADKLRKIIYIHIKLNLTRGEVIHLFAFSTFFPFFFFAKFNSFIHLCFFQKENTSFQESILFDNTKDCAIWSESIYDVRQ